MVVQADEHESAMQQLLECCSRFNVCIRELPTGYLWPDCDDSRSGSNAPPTRGRFPRRTGLLPSSPASNTAYRRAIAVAGNHKVKGESGSRSTSWRSYQLRAWASLASTTTPIILISTESRRQRCKASADSNAPSFASDGACQRPGGQGVQREAESRGIASGAWQAGSPFG